MSRWTLFSAFLLLMSTVGCAGLVGQRYAGNEMAPRGPMLDGSHVAFAGYSEFDHGGCTSCGGGELSSISPRVRHSCDDRKQCAPYCDRCEGGSEVTWRGTRGMPLLDRLKSQFVCGDGCGEVYIGEWISTPPTPDPCDTCGNFTGDCNHLMYRPHRQPVRNALRLASGVRYAAFGCGGCGEEGCDLCDESIEEYQDSIVPYAPEFISPMAAPHAHGSGCSCGGH